MSQTVGDWLYQAQTSLTDSDTARLDAELLLMHVLDVNRAWLFTWPEKELLADQQVMLEQLLKRRQQGEPIAHLTRVREFWSLPLEVSPSTLIPRPDTETLIEQVLELILPAHARVVDLGTGTGAIALALASEYPGWQIDAVECNAEAAALARRNNQRLGFNITIKEGSWFEPLDSRYDLIVSNPPYIDPNDHHLNEGDVRFEPLSALVADEQGLSDLKQIITQAPDYLHDGGWLLLEHGYDQAETVCELLHQRGFSQVENHQDLGGQPRISGGCWRGGDL